MNLSKLEKIVEKQLARAELARVQMAAQDPWAGGSMQSTQIAQRQFQRARRFSAEQVEWADEYHDSQASGADRARIDAIEGDEGQIIA